MKKRVAFFLLVFAATSIESFAAVVWMVGMDDGGWPMGDGGGPNASFVQEAGINALPGNPNSPEVDVQADDDYYFSGIYTTVIPGNGAYGPVGVVPANEEAAERAVSAGDNNRRYHFNLPGTLRSNDLLTVTFDPLNLDDMQATTGSRYGLEAYINGVLVMPQIIIRPENLGIPVTTPPFSLASVDAQTGPGFDNIVTLRGVNYFSQGGGNWLGFDYIQLDSQVPEPATGILALAAVGILALVRRRAS